MRLPDELDISFRELMPKWSKLIQSKVTDTTRELVTDALLHEDFWHNCSEWRVPLEMEVAEDPDNKDPKTVYQLQLIYELEEARMVCESVPA